MLGKKVVARRFGAWYCEYGGTDMKVKIGDTIHDTENEPIMIILNTNDKENILRMPRDKTKYCGYPTGSEIDIHKFMKID